MSTINISIDANYVPESRRWAPITKNGPFPLRETLWWGGHRVGRVVVRKHVLEKAERGINTFKCLGLVRIECEKILLPDGQFGAAYQEALVKRNEKIKDNPVDESGSPQIFVCPRFSMNQTWYWEVNGTSCALKVKETPQATWLII